MAPGYRFYPTEEEIISFYLHNKLEGLKEEIMNRVIPVIDIYGYNPSQLPQISGEASMRDTEQWFFFIPRQESEARGGRPKRLTTTGFWKATGSPNLVYSKDNQFIGMKRTMVFYTGRAQNGTKTDWKMNEYKKAIEVKASSSSNKTDTTQLRHEFSLCRVYKKSKCLRSFDRRPSPRRNTYNVQNVQDQHQIASTCYDHNTPQMVLETETGATIARSPDESSSSEDHGQPSHIVGESSQMEVDINEPLLNWEQVDWFLGSEP
ncbi:hypothetical protein TanjilG_19620 [Lupinus angustifolius]|uniref:Similar to domain-containing protein 90-like n=2 Tax=Lupinus angustifolius TaxID=3871 RepID=L0P181_LUPAN|nr:hypothetical protein TanjilG_19620 [Lupinus angustifolius]CCH47182.1 similar to domain-containing protein 90-like [Lupinus angustifolius]